MGDLPRILVVDDSVEFGDLMRLILSRRGFDVDIALDGWTALSLLGTGRYDLAIVDLMLPGMDGFEIMRRAREQHVNTKWVLFSAKADKDTTAAAYGVGAEAVWHKPLMPHELVDNIQRVLAKSSQ